MIKFIKSFLFGKDRNQTKKIEPRISLPLGSTISIAGNLLQETCYNASKNGGWHNDILTGEPRTMEQNEQLFPLRIALCHSELSEALEGDRKKLMDDHLPHRKMSEVELADAAIRIFDLAGSMGYNLGDAISEKIEYNAKRADHKIENRNKEDGKKY